MAVSGPFLMRPRSRFILMPMRSSRSGGIPAIEHALCDGEDFELCVVVSSADAARLLAEPPEGATLYRIGEIIVGAGT